MKNFLLDETRKKQLQIVISTHSPSIIEDLPADAIKVFSQFPTGKFNVKKEITPEEAFYHLEQTNPNKKTIIVEDYLAKQILTEVLNSKGADTASLFEITFHSGGQTVLKNNFITVYSKDGLWNKFIIFDGNQNTGTPHFNPDEIIGLEQTNERYKAEIRKQTGIEIQFFPDGNGASVVRADQEKMLMYNYLKYYSRNVFYLPFKTPEDIIWDDELATNLLQSLGKKTRSVQLLLQEILRRNLN